MVFQAKHDNETQTDSIAPSSCFVAEACNNKDISDDCNTNSEDSEVFQKAFAARASFKSPEIWMLVFGNVLAVCAGIVDAGSILSFGVATTHMSGPTARQLCP